MQALPPKKNFIRALSYLTGFVIKTCSDGCNISYVTQSDPKGKSAVLVIITSLPHDRGCRNCLFNLMIVGDIKEQTITLGLTGKKCCILTVASV